MNTAPADSTLPSSAGSKLFLFTAAGFDFAVPIVDVDRLFEELDISPVPLCHPALAGVALDDDGPEPRLIPIFDLRGFLPRAEDDAEEEDLPEAIPVHVKGATVAVFQTETGPIGMRMDRLLGTSAVAQPIDDASVVEERVAALGAELLTTVTAVARIEDRIFYTFSPEAFLMRLRVQSPSM